MSRQTLTLAAAVWLAAGASAARATDYTSQTTGAWSSESTWTPTGRPVTGDTATIAEDTVVHVDSLEKCDSATVNKKTNGQNDGVLELRAGGDLQVKDTVTVQEGGVFRFNATSGIDASKLTSTGTPLTLSGAFTVTGSVGGEIGREGANTVELSTNGLITNDAGLLIISAPILNNGVIRCTATYPAHQVSFEGAIDPDSMGRFETTEVEALMVFESGSGGGTDGLWWDCATDGPFFDIQKGGMTFEDSFGRRDQANCDDGPCGPQSALRILNGFIKTTGSNQFIANRPFSE